jgi:peptidoglycan/LPS O-acetylase OafA/YrhL
MLQRSQTLYLLGVLLLAILMLTGPLARFASENGELTLRHTGLFDSKVERMEPATWPLTLSFAAIVLLSLVNILSYRNRGRQMRLCIFLILLSAGTAGLMFYYTWFVRQSLGTGPTLYLWRFVVPPVSMILLYLAFRRIRRDELLVKAYDRIR